MTYKDELGYVGHPELPHGYYPYLGVHPLHRDDWIARVALAAAMVLLFPVAIALGHVSLGRHRRGSAANRRAAVVALWIGYGAPALLGTGVGIALVVYAMVGTGMLG